MENLTWIPYIVVWVALLLFPFTRWLLFSLVTLTLGLLLGARDDVLPD